MHPHYFAQLLSAARALLLRAAACPHTQESFDTIRAMVIQFVPELPADHADSTASEILLKFHGTGRRAPLAVDILLAIVLTHSIAARRRHGAKEHWEEKRTVNAAVLENVAVSDCVARREFTSGLETAINALSNRPRQVLEIRVSYYPTALTARQVQEILNRTIDPTATRRAVRNADLRVKAALLDFCKQFNVDPRGRHRAAKRT